MFVVKAYCVHFINAGNNLGFSVTDFCDDLISSLEVKRK